MKKIIHPKFALHSSRALQAIERRYSTSFALSQPFDRSRFPILGRGGGHRGVSFFNMKTETKPNIRQTPRNTPIRSSLTPTSPAVRGRCTSMKSACKHSHQTSFRSRRTSLRCSSSRRSRWLRQRYIDDRNMGISALRFRRSTPQSLHLLLASSAPFRGEWESMAFQISSTQSAW